MKYEFPSWNNFETARKSIARWYRENKLQCDSIFGIPRGGLILAVTLSHDLELPCVYDEKAITPKTLVCDDISDTGKTLLPFKNKNYKIVTWYYHDNSLVVPDYYVSKKTSEWVQFPWESTQEIPTQLIER